MLDRWKKAVVHLEGASDSNSMEDMERITLDLLEGRLTQQQSDEAIMAGMRDIRYQGTALYVQRDQKFFLVTARHVVHDAVEGQRMKERMLQSVRPFPAEMVTFMQKNAEDQLQDSIFKIIFRVLPLDETTRAVEASMPINPGRFLMNLGAGTPINRPYSYSKADLDLAVISLHSNFWNSDRFKQDLDANGYVPIDFSDISDGPSEEGAEIFTVGFPQSTSTVGVINLEPGAQGWSSNTVSLPVFAFGRVAMLHNDLPGFWGDISIYPGNSGGPVVEDNKLVGIVSANATIPSEDAKSHLRIPFAHLIKGKYVKDLILKQIEKEEQFEASRTMQMPS